MRTGLILSNPFGAEPLPVNIAANTTQAASLTKRTELRFTSTGMLMVHPNSLETVSNQKQVFQKTTLVVLVPVVQGVQGPAVERPQRQGTFRWLFRSVLLDTGAVRQNSSTCCCHGCGPGGRAVESGVHLVDWQLRS